MDRRKAILFAILVALECLDDDLRGVAACLGDESAGVAAALSILRDKRAGVRGRRWALARNSRNWFFEYALDTSFVNSAAWRSTFRISYDLFCRIVTDLRETLTAQSTRLRAPLRAELKLAAFLMYSGGGSYSAVANQLGIGVSTVGKIIPQVARLISGHYRTSIALPTEEGDVAKLMKGFEDIRGLPYCVGAIDGTHIKWLACPEQQYYEYRCYKGFPSIVILAVAAADRKIIYADIGCPGVLGDCTIYERSSLKKAIESGSWVGSDRIPSLNVGDVQVRPYLIGDCAFSLGTNMMKTAS